MPSPYREKGEPSAAIREIARPRDPLEGLGTLRETFKPRRSPLVVTLFVGAVALAAAIGHASDASSRILSVGTHAVPLLFGAGWILLLVALGAYAIHAVRARSVLLYANGLIVQSKRARDIAHFESVDEVWWNIEPKRGSVHELATMSAVRLKDHDGSWHHVPLTVARFLDLANAITRQCSFPLHGEALRMLGRGETLTFAAVHLDREAIATDSWSLNWSEVSRLRIFPARVCIFRRRSQQLVPWRTINLSEVPHPTIFLACVRDCAKAHKTPLEEPTRAWIEADEAD